MEYIILSELIRNKKYTKRVLPYLKVEYFDEFSDKTIYKLIGAYIKKYNKLPTLSAIMVGLGNIKNLSEDQYSSVVERLEEMKNYDEENDFEWLIDETEAFCRNKAIEVALMKSVEIVEAKKNTYIIRDLIDEALKINFDRNIGIEFFDEKSILERIEYYKEKKVKYETHLKKLNQVTDGGFEPKTLSVFFGDTHVGKCVAADTKVTIRNKRTGEIKSITIKEFHDIIRSKIFEGMK